MELKSKYIVGNFPSSLFSDLVSANQAECLTYLRLSKRPITDKVIPALIDMFNYEFRMPLVTKYINSQFFY